MIFQRRPQFEPPITRIKPKRSKKLRAFFWILALIVASIVGWIGVTGIVAFGNITDKNDSEGPSFFKFGDEIDPASLEEGETRINVLLVGADNAAGLTDSIQIFSIDPINNLMSMVSVPRDLYVKNPLGGKSKINEVYNAGIKKCSQTKTCDKSINQGAAALKSVLREVLGTDIHYFARVDFEGFKDVVDAIGGVTIYVDKALSDPGYPCDNDASKVRGYSQKAGSATMNGTQALKYARCRNGTCGNDFGRSQRQQQLIEAIRQKTLSLGVLSNPKKITDLITALGSHFKTDTKLDEMLKIFDLLKTVDRTKTITKVLDNGTDGPLRSTNNGSYVLIPKAGADDWSEVHNFVLSAMPEPYVIKEAANVVIVDASGKGLGKGVEAMLTGFGYTIVGSEVATTTSTTGSLWADGEHKYTTALLKKRFAASQTNKQPTTQSTVDRDIVLVIGSNYILK